MSSAGFALRRWDLHKWWRDPSCLPGRLTHGSDRVRDPRDLGDSSFEQLDPLAAERAECVRAP